MTPPRKPTRVLAVFGTRPEAIKMSPILHVLQARAAGGDPVRHAVCVTAQHREMLDQVLELFGVRPDYDLDLMTEDQTPAEVSAAALAGMEPVLAAEEPDWVLVQGDTNTTAAAALAAHYSRVRVAHVEAGLRTHDRWQPFPEETNRRIVSAVADLHFAPTEAARRNLLNEGVPTESILVTGNTAIDALGHVLSTPPPPGVRDILARVAGSSRSGEDKLLLVTAHRRENLGEPLARICAAVRELASTHPGLQVVFPVHMNPAVRERVHQDLAGLENVRLTAPLDYASMVHLMDAAYLVLTDSGGIQEEAPSLRTPVLVMREVTERSEGVDAGVARLVGTDTEKIVDAARRLLEDRREHDSMTTAVNPYGDGRSSLRIVRALLGEPVEEFTAAPLR